MQLPRGNESQAAAGTDARTTLRSAIQPGETFGSSPENASGASWFRNLQALERRGCYLNSRPTTYAAGTVTLSCMPSGMNSIAPVG